ncbi:hypothetical protein GPECTOR_33g642 [Gonium pectorale]|uniref:Uncharacterized protein n=1 Tax=Gonium pectorale TaxID=33097 RepID=A0A150GEI4_GONPE|nr:hypothetical protein GPECTOR_33g642 [Gonium pectorale]|eukprot:KXZ47760.1 hypothetical protein GPECTOR_33g642 [Gonium pectorale]
MFTHDAHAGARLSSAAGWAALLETLRHPHPRVRTACLGAVRQACSAAAAATPGANPAPAPPGGGAAGCGALDPAAAAAAYAAAAAALEDDAEEPRAAAVQLVSELALLVPDLPYGTHFGVAARLADDGFMRLCARVGDTQRGLRLQALRALGGGSREALSKKTTLRVAAPAPVLQGGGAAGASAGFGAPGSMAPPGAVGGGTGGGSKRGASGDAGAPGASAAASGAAAKRLTTSAWEPQPRSWLAAARPAACAGASGAAGQGAGAGGGEQSRGGGANADLELLENAVGAFVLGGEDEHWEVRVATLEAMARLAEHEYRSAMAAAAAAAVDAAASATAAVAGGDRPAPGIGNARGAGGGGGGGQQPAALSVRIGGIGGLAGSRIAAGGGNAEAAAAVCEALLDSLLDELPEVRRAAAAGLLRLLRLEAEERKRHAAADAAAAAAAGAPVELGGAQPRPQAPKLQPQPQPQPQGPQPQLGKRASLPPLLGEEGARALAAAARDSDGHTRRDVLRALGCVRPARPGLLRELVQESKQANE